MKVPAPILLLVCAFSEISAGSDWHHAETRRHPAAEAIQGVAVDADHFYAITNRAIGKYHKGTGARIAVWEDTPDGHLRHLNAGVVFGGKLYCAHSNFPKRPEESSIEIWDTQTLRHLESHSFDQPPGSLTWVDQRDGRWFACFAHYRASSDPALSRVVSFDADWKPQQTWTFPAGVIARFVHHSSSGGSFGPGGHLFVTGHDAKELYILDLPAGGGEMVWLDTVAISAAGQAFAWDRTPGAEGVLYSIQRKTKEVIVSRVVADGFNPCLIGTPLPVGSTAGTGRLRMEPFIVMVADPQFKPLPIPPAALEKENERARKMVEQAKANPKKP